MAQVSGSSPRGKIIWTVLVSLMVLAVFAASGVLLSSTVDQERRAEREQLLGDLRAALSRSSSLSADFVEERQRHVREVSSRLTMQAAAVAGEVHLCLQGAIADYRAQTPSWRDGLFEAVENFAWLGEIPIKKVQEPSDWPEKVLVECGPEILKILSPTVSLTVSEVGSRPILQLGGAELGKDTITASASREFIFMAGNGNRRWMINIVAAEENGMTEPTPAGLSRELEKKLDGVFASAKVFRGVILGADGEVLEVFPRSAPTRNVLPLPDKSDEWVEYSRDGERRLTRLEMLDPLAPCKWGLGVQMGAADATHGERMLGVLRNDWRWTAFPAFAGLAIVGIALLVSRCGGAADPAGTRLVRSGKARAVAEGAGLIVAEVGEGGNVSVRDATREALLNQKPRPGSLYRLHKLHRGSPEANSSRILDHVRSPVLRKLVQKVRPQAAPSEKASVRKAAAGAGAGKAPATRDKPLFVVGEQA